LRDAWRAATSASGDAAPRLAITTCTTCDILCERRPTTQALEHLFRAASERISADGTIEVIGKRRGGSRGLEIRMKEGSDPSHQLVETGSNARRGGADPRTHASLRVILARLLLEVQGATLACQVGDDGSWAAQIEFPARR
jgi:hypothetical protein